MITISSDSTFVKFLRDGRYVVGGNQEGQIRRWRADSGREVGKPKTAGPRDIQVLCLAVSRDGKWLVSGTEHGRVAVWDAETLSKVLQFNAHQDFQVETVDVSPDGTRIATGSHDSTVCIWSLSTGERLFWPLGHSSSLAAVKYSPDGRLLATATCARNSIRIYSEGGRFIIEIPIEVDRCDESIAWSHDTKYLYALSDGNIMRIDVSTWKTVSEWPIHNNDDPRSIILAGNGRFIVAAANSTLSFWDATTGSQIGPVIEHEDTILSTDISPNYDLVYSGLRSFVLRNIRDILPLHYFNDMQFSDAQERPRADSENATLKETVKLLLSEVRSLRAQQDRTYKKIAKIEDTVRVIREEVVELPHKAKRETDDLTMTIESLREAFEEFRDELAESRRKADCE